MGCWQKLPTNRSRDDALRAVASYASKSGAEREAPLIPTSELQERVSQGERVILIDVRCKEEMLVSMIPGAVTKDTFEAELLPGLLQGGGEETSQPLLVPYCTVGYRSGLYCRELIQKHGLRHVRNGEGVIMWTFDGNCLVKPLPGSVPARAPAAATTAEVYGKVDVVSDGPPGGSMPAWEAVTQVHVFGKAWDMAAEGYTTVFFSQAGGVARYLRQKCGAKVVLWLFVFILFYLFFTPACGVMFDCGCRMALSKWGQVETCNIFGGGPRSDHRCPWCSCSGALCIFVSSDSKAFRGVPLLDMLPDGFFLTVVTVLVLHFSWRKVDMVGAKKSVQPGLLAAGQATLAVLWFLVYCLVWGGIFFAASPEYPYFLGIERAPPGRNLLSTSARNHDGSWWAWAANTSLPCEGDGVGCI